MRYYVTGVLSAFGSLGMLVLGAVWMVTTYTAPEAAFTHGVIAAATVGSALLFGIVALAAGTEALADWRSRRPDP